MDGKQEDLFSCVCGTCIPDTHRAFSERTTLLEKDQWKTPLSDTGPLMFLPSPSQNTRMPPSMVVL